jgi:AraC-like DNA-binding protein/quercetin dioxygenase-like cupin family protein
VPDNIEIVPFALELNMEQMPELGVRRYDFQPFQECDWHSHDAEAQLSYVERGSLTLNMATRFWAVLPSCAVWIPPREGHSLEVGPRGCALRTVWISSPVPVDLPTSPCVVYVSPFLASLIAAWDERVEADSERREALGRLIHDELRTATISDLSLPQVQDSRLQRIAEAMRKEPDRNMDLEGWAQLANMSRRTLCRHFLEDTGMSLPEWQRNLRLMLARQYLEEGVSVTQVALSLGYDSPSAFIAMFKRVFGTTPKRFTSVSAF